MDYNINLVEVYWIEVFCSEVFMKKNQHLQEEWEESNLAKLKTYTNEKYNDCRYIWYNRISNFRLKMTMFNKCIILTWKLSLANFYCFLLKGFFFLYQTTLCKFLRTANLLDIVSLYQIYFSIAFLSGENCFHQKKIYSFYSILIAR